MGIWWNPGQVCMLSRGLQAGSPHREWESSQILPGITASFSPPCPLPRLSVSVWLLSASHVPLTSFHLPSTLVLPVRLCLLPLPSSLTFLTLRPRRLFVLCFFFFRTLHSSPRISRWSGRNRGRVAVILEGEGVWKTQACGGLIRHPRWQGSLAWIG